MSAVPEAPRTARSGGPFHQRVREVARPTTWPRGRSAPIRTFLHAESGGAAALAAAALLALLWANVSPTSYASVWETRLALAIGPHQLATDLRGWVDQGLMTLFFLVVGLEARRELDLGELRERARLAIPASAALGGMAFGAGLYLAINAGGPGAAGWGAAVSTDTALALGALTLLTGGRAMRLRVFLLTLVVVDDLVALLVIAVGYTDRISAGALALALALFCVLIALRWAGRWRGQAAVPIAVGIWIALFESGIDPVVAGLAIGLITAAYPPARRDLERSTDLARSFREQPTPELAYTARASLTSALSRNERLQYRLLPWSSWVIVPLFALANAGIALDRELLSAALRSPITWGLLASCAVAKPLGILAGAWLASRPRFGGARPTVTWPALTGGAAAAGVSFTVSLLVATLAFEGRALELAKIGVLASGFVSPVLAWVAFRIAAALPAPTRTRQLGATARTIVDLSTDVDTNRDHVRGRLDASVTLVQYGDYECASCAEAARAVAMLLDRLDGSLRYVFRHLPLTDVHPNAQLAAEAAEAAAAQGVFWEMHDRLLEHPPPLSALELFRVASGLGLELGRFENDMRQRRHADRVAEDVRSADASGVAGTPTFFVDGRRHRGGHDLAALSRAVSAALAGRV